MNPTLELNFWWRLLGILALETSLIIALAFVAQIIIRSAFWRRAVWQITFVCLLFVAGAELTGVGRGISVWLAGKPAPERKVSVRIIPNEESFRPPPVDEEIPEPIFLPKEETPVARSVWWPGLLWLAGGGLIVARILSARMFLFLLRYRKKRITDAALLGRVAELARRLNLRRKTLLLETPGLSSPMTFGVILPTIGLPTGFAQKFTPAQQDAILTHELAHLAARDPFWYLLADFAAALLWWQPLIWWARHRLHSASEHAADEAAALLENGPGTLAECLVHLGQQMTCARSFGWLGVDGSGFRSHLGQRVERLLKLGPARDPQRSWKTFVTKTGATIVFAALIIFTSGWIQNKDAQRPKDWKSALQQSWNGSFASLAVIALAENKTTPTTEFRAAEMQTEKSAKTLKKRIEKSNSLVGAGKLDGAEKKYKKSALSDLALLAEAQLKAKPSTAPALPSKGAATALVQDGKLLFELGKLDEAEAKLNEALQLNPANTAAFYYKNLIKEARYRKQSNQRQLKESGLIYPTLPPKPVEKPRPLAEAEKAKDSANPAAPGTREREAKAALVAVQKAWELPVPNRTDRTNVIYDTRGRQTIKSKLDRIRLPEVAFEGVPLGEVLKWLRDESKKRDPEEKGINFFFNPRSSAPTPPAQAGFIDPAATIFTPAPDAPLDLNKVTINITPALTNVRLADVLDAIVQTADQPIDYKIEDYAIVFAPKSREAVTYYTRTYKVNLTNFLDSLKRAFPNWTNENGAVSKRRDERGNGTIIEYPDPQFNTRQGMGLGSVTRTNHMHAVNQLVRDYFTAAGVDFGVRAPGGSGGITPNGKALFFNDRTGILMVKATLEDFEIISSALEALNPEPSAPTKEEKTPPKKEATVEKPLEANKLYTRTYKVNSTNFVEGMKRAVPNWAEGYEVYFDGLDGRPVRNPLEGPLKNQLPVPIALVARQYFLAAGVDFGRVGAPFAASEGGTEIVPNGKTLFFSEGTGLLMVRATPKDLEIVSKAIEALDVAPVAGQERQKLPSKNEVSAEKPQKKTASSSNEREQILVEAKFVEIGESPGKKNDWNWLVAGSGSQLVTNENIGLKPIHGFTNFSSAFPPGTLSNSIPRFVTTVLAESRAREILRQIEGQRGADVLSAPKVSTLERAAQVSIEDEVKIRLNPKEPELTTIRTGRALDLLPKELADGMTVHLTVNAMIKEVVKKRSGVLRKESYSPKVRQMAAEANLYDGQTLVLAEIMEGKQPPQKKRLLVFVTAQMLNAKGERVHSEKELSFTTNSVPKQPEQK